MKEFTEPTKSSELLKDSHLVNEMEEQASKRDEFKVISDGEVGTFHDISGGYNKGMAAHQVNLIHRVQGDGSPPKSIYSPSVEAHMDDFFYMEVDDIRIFDSYPDDDYVLSLFVSDYTSGPYSFSQALSEEPDRRETQHSYDGADR